MNTENEEVLLRSNDEAETSVREHRDEQRNREHHRMSRRERDHRHARNVSSREREQDSHRPHHHSSSRTHQTSHNTASSTHTRRRSRSTEQTIQAPKRKSKYNCNSSSCIQSLIILLFFYSRTLLQMWQARAHKEELQEPNQEKTTETTCAIYI